MFIELTSYSYTVKNEVLATMTHGCQNFGAIMTLKYINMAPGAQITPRCQMFEFHGHTLVLY